MKEQKQSVRWGYLLMETALILIGSYLLLVASTKTNQLNPGVLLINAVLLTAAAVFLALRSGGDNGLETPIAVMMIVMLAASFFSIDPRRSLGEFGLAAAPVVLFFMIQEGVKRGLPKELVVKSLLVVGAIFMIYSWQETIGWYIAWLSANPGDFLPSTNFRLDDPNLLAMLFNVWLMMAATRFLAGKTRAERIILGAYCLSCLGIIFFTSSRGGWMATAAGFLILGLVFFRMKEDQWLPAWKKIRQNRVVMTAGAVIFLAGAAAAGYLLYRQMTHPSHGSRSAIWTPAVQAFLQSPLIGRGPFTFISSYLEANSVPTAIPYDYAHSIYLDLLSGAGILGLAAFLFLMAMVVRIFISRIREAQGADWAVAVGGLAALATFLVHGFVDTTHHSEPISLWNMCIAAGAALSLPGMAQKRRDWRAATPVVLALAAAGLAWFAWWTLLPMQEGVGKAAAGDWQGAALKFDEAVQRDGSMAASHQQSGLAHSMLAADGDDAELAKAISQLEETMKIDPYWSLNHANLAALYRSAARLEEARDAFEEAVRLSPRSEVFQLNLGAVREELGDLNGAGESYRAALAIKPDWAESGYWRATAFRGETLEAWQAENPDAPRKDLEGMQADVNARPDALAVYLPLIRTYLDQGNLPEAERMIARAGFAAGWNALQFELEWNRVELEAGKRDYQKAAERGAQVISAATRYGIFGPASPGNNVYNLFMFRRPAVDIDFVPRVELITWPDKWGYRALQLAGWFEMTGDSKSAAFWRQTVTENIPDLPLP